MRSHQNTYHTTQHKIKPKISINADNLCNTDNVELFYFNSGIPRILQQRHYSCYRYTTKSKQTDRVYQSSPSFVSKTPSGGDKLNFLC